MPTDMLQLITRCPQCETAFSFETAQLRLAQGWVRCGRCACLFEADKHLFERTKHTPTPPSAGLSAAQVAQSHLPREPLTEMTALRDDLSAIHQTLDELSELQSHAPGDHSVERSELEKMRALSMQINSSGLHGIGSPELTLSEPHRDSAEPAQQRSEPRASDWIYTLFITVMVMCLLLQLLWAKREVIAAFSEQTHALVQSLCDAMGEPLDWPQEPQSLKIESSSLKSVGPVDYHLKLRLRNEQDYGVKTPALELSVLDAAEEVLVRKIFTREQLSLQAAVFADKDLVIAFELQLDDAIARRVAGYKIDFFYP